MCGMDLVVVRSDLRGSPSGNGRQIILTPQEQSAMGLRLAQMQVIPSGSVLRASGHLTLPAPEQMISGIDGVVSEVFEAPGTVGGPRLPAGRPLVALSAKEIRDVEQVLLDTSRSDAERLSARRQLAAFGLSDDGIQTLERAGTASDRLVLRSPKSLMLLTAPRPGSQARKGGELFTFIDLSTLYIDVDVRSSDITAWRSGMPVEATLPSHPGMRWHGEVAQTAAQFDERAQTLRVRLQFPNERSDLWQGMLAFAELRTGGRRMLAVPESSVIQKGAGDVVYVAKTDNLFESRAVKTGERIHSMVEIKSGLSEGEKVVSSATFLIDSEMRLRAGLPGRGSN
jgi:Cu(I)/Ag(I) efflux system membrane fusion protein